MIKIKFEYNDKYITNVKVTGHANFKEYGKDIVCAAVSSIAITSINACLKINKESLDVKSGDGLIDAKVNLKDETINNILLNMKDMFIELEKQYSKNVKII